MPSRFQLANAIRMLSMDAVQLANSGHPGMPMGMADIAEVLWRDYLQHNPQNPKWFNRDRFVLSNGHGCMLLYSLLHLTGYDVTIDDIKNFRQLHSKTPGHPEFGHTPGVETTTGPLGQGLAAAVGMAIAEASLAARFNQPGFNLVDHFTYVFAGDGCLMEGISHESCSLAGTLGLGKLILFYDDNGISIDGKVEGWFTDNTPERFHSYNWHVVENVNGHDADAIQTAIEAARAERNKPTIICLKTTIGFGAVTLAGSHKTHGAPLGAEEIAKVRENLKWPYEPFTVPDDIYNQWDAKANGEKLERKWQQLLSDYKKQYPELAQEFVRRINSELPTDLNRIIAQALDDPEFLQKTQATRKSSLQVLELIAPLMPELMGGSADLTGSNLTMVKSATAISAENKNGNYIYYGVREFAMSAIINGLSLHGGFVPYGGTFLVFSDYARNAVRLAALMQAKSIFVYSHDSIGLGEDGPTHQPIEHLAMLRLTPGLRVWRPADVAETLVAWQQALLHNGPSCLVLSRQNVIPVSPLEKTADIAKGGYIVFEAAKNIDAIIIATGSEVEIAVAAAEKLQTKGVSVRVVSMPSVEVFSKQDKKYQQQVLPTEITARVAVEAAAKDYWYKFVGMNGAIVGLDSFGASAPAEDLFKEFGITVDNIISKVEQVVAANAEKVLA